MVAQASKSSIRRRVALCGLIGLATAPIVACSSSSAPTATGSTTTANAGSTSVVTPLVTSSQPQGVSQVVPSTPRGPRTVQTTPKRVPDTSGIEGVKAWETDDGPGALSHDHVGGPVDYAVTPPVGGPHNGEWMNAGIYTVPVPNERAVHNLEHGAVWITYRPGLPAAQIAELTAFVKRQSEIPDASGQGAPPNRYVDLSPWADDSLPSPIVISSWGHQLWVESPTDPRLQRFVDTFRNSPKYTPEYGAPVNGVPVSIGGRPSA